MSLNKSKDIKVLRKFDVDLELTVLPSIVFKITLGILFCELNVIENNIKKQTKLK